MQTIGVILLNLGGPERLSDVEPFLLNLFSDRQIIRLGPAFLQRPIARFIAKRRAPKSRESYRQIGGGSPLRRITAAQGEALAERLGSSGSFRIGMAMRYWQPTALEVLTEMHQAGVRRLVALSLYPHYSVATTGSSLDDLRQAARAFSPAFEIAEVEAWPDQPDYVASLAETVREGLQEAAAGEPRLLYSAHSLPQEFIERGDPYVEHLKRTIAALEAQTGVPGRLCFQSRSGPVRWLAPSTPEMLAKVAEEGGKHVLLVPLSFVSDHVETLYEIDIQYRELARELGLGLSRTPSLNTRPRFILALQNLVLAACGAREWIR